MKMQSIYNQQLQRVQQENSMTAMYTAQGLHPMYGMNFHPNTSFIKNTGPEPGDLHHLGGYPQQWTSTEDQLLYQLHIVEKRPLLEIVGRLQNKTMEQIEQRCKTNF